MLTEAEFRTLAERGYNRIPLVEASFADLDTPLSLYLKLAGTRDTFLLESVVGGERFGRYSFIGLPARTRIAARGRAIEVSEGGRIVERHDGDPIEFVRGYMKRFRAAPLPDLPRFCGGLAGMFGYDMVRHIEGRLAGKAKPPTPGLADVPDMLLVLTEELAVVDNLAGRISLIVYADPNERGAYARGVERLAELKRKLRVPVSIPYQTAGAKTQGASEFGESAFKDAVGRAREYIAAGDIMQVVISQRMSRPFAASRDLALPGAALDQPVALHVPLRFRRLPGRRRVARDPRAQGGSRHHAASDRGHAAARAHARGRRGARGGAGLDDPKEIAEHVMLVDLGRNDVGRVAAIGSVRVTERMVVERYSHVMHIVSNVEGTLKPGLASLDVLRAAFPAGTVSGAPKVRAMEIIDELEPTKRGIYSGAAGYISFQDDMDTAIVLRTAVLKDGVLYAQAGGGIVHDSSPDGEWQETLNKLRAVLRAAEMVQQGLDEG